MSEKEIKAVFVELVQNDHKKVVDGVETIQKGETRKYWYKNEEYPTEVLDYGSFWDVCPSSHLCLATPDGVAVVDDVGMLSDLLEIIVSNLVGEALKLEPGQWVEREFDDWYGSGCRVRMTAHAELPPLSAAQTVKVSGLSPKAMTRIRINGKPLYAYGTMEDGDRAWFPDLYDLVAGAVVSAIRAKGGPSAEVTFHGTDIGARKASTLLTFELKAKSREGLVEFLRNLGVPNPETMKVSKTIGDADGVKCVYTLFTAADHVDS